jgi:hypothetical protein
MDLREIGVVELADDKLEVQMFVNTITNFLVP